MAKGKASGPAEESRPTLRFLDTEAVERRYRGMFRAGSTLTAAVEAPRRMHHYEDEQDLVRLAAAVLLAVTRAHALVDGNKRASICLADELLGLNGHRLEGADDELAAVGWAAAAGELASMDSLAGRLRPLVVAGSPERPFEERHPAVIDDLAR